MCFFTVERENIHLNRTIIPDDNVASSTRRHLIIMQLIILVETHVDHDFCFPEHMKLPPYLSRQDISGHNFYRIDFVSPIFCPHDFLSRIRLL